MKGLIGAEVEPLDYALISSTLANAMREVQLAHAALEGTKRGILFREREVFVVERAHLFLRAEDRQRMSRMLGLHETRARRAEDALVRATLSEGTIKRRVSRSRRALS